MYESIMWTYIREEQNVLSELLRNKEVDGEDYYFVSQEEFQRNLDAGNLLEHCEFVGNRYGTPKDKVEEQRNAGKNVFLEIEVNGANQVLSKVNDSGVISIFLMPPSLKALEDRIKKRKSETDEAIRERLEKGRSEMKLKDNYEYVVVNDQVETAASKISKIIKKRIKALYGRKEEGA